KGENPLASRRIPDPFIRVGSRHGKPRLDLDERAGATIGKAMHLSQAAAILDRRKPRLEEISAEREQIAGFTDRVLRNGIATKRDSVCGAHGFIAEWFVDDARSRTQRANPLVHESGERARLGPAHDCNLASPISLRQRPYLADQWLQRFVPPDRF